MTVDLAAQIESLGPRRVREMKRALVKEIGQALVARIGDELELYSAATLERVFRCLATGNFSTLGELLPRDVDSESEQDEQDHEAVCSRIRYLRAIGDDEEAQAAEIAKCAADPLHWINQWVWMADPRPAARQDEGELDLEVLLEDESGFFDELLRDLSGGVAGGGLSVRPILLWPRQVQLVAWVFWLLKNGTSGIGKKSRDVGFSVLMCALAVWLWLFRPGTSVGFGSRKEDLVDRIGKLDALFPKMRFILARLPVWMLPRGFNWRRHSTEMLLVNPENGSDIKGEGGKNIGNAGRSTIYFFDEFSLVEHQEAAHQGLSSNTNTAIYFGRSAGTQTYFYEMEAKGTYPVFRFPWYYDPRKIDHPEELGHPQARSKWADAMRRSLGDAKFAEIYACDDDEAVDNVMVPVSWVQAAVDIKLPETDAAAVAGIDVADGGVDESVLCIRRGPHIRFWTWDVMTAATLPIPTAKICEREAVRWAYFDAQGVGQDFGGGFIERAHGFAAMGFHGHLPASKHRVLDDFPIDAGRPFTCDLRFRNQITEQWWAMRLRFRKTYEYVQWQRDGSHGEAPHALDDLISIDDDPQLRKQLKRRYFLDGSGKIAVQDKKSMQGSPDRADALAMTECITLQYVEQLPAARRAGVIRSRFHTINF